jgi:hypothetical protein
MEIKGIKLQNGMDIICKDLTNDGMTYGLSKAVAIHITQDASGKPNMGFLPLTFFALDSKDGMNVEIDKHHVLFVYTPNNDITAGYTEFSSGLAVPKKPQIIL